MFAKLVQSVEHSKPFDCKSLANVLLDWAQLKQVSMSNMKLQKIVYFCHADVLAATGRPLIDQTFEAWEYGPVIPSLYTEFKIFGAGPITGRATKFNPATCIREVASDCNLGGLEKIVSQSFERYVRYSASALSNLSHSENGPWAAALARFERGSHRGRNIENELIERHHIHAYDRSLH